MPASVFIPEGQTVSPAFNVTSNPVAAKQVGLITAGVGQGAVSRGITINVGNGASTGSIGVNLFTLDFAAPFGGFKESGIGREYGPEGISAFTETQSIHRDKPAPQAAPEDAA